MSVDGLITLLKKKPIFIGLVINIRALYATKYSYVFNFTPSIIITPRYFTSVTSTSDVIMAAVFVLLIWRFAKRETQRCIIWISPQDILSAVFRGNPQSLEIYPKLIKIAFFHTLSIALLIIDSRSYFMFTGVTLTPRVYKRLTPSVLETNPEAADFIT
jgi:hypothetical protein